MVAVSRGKIIKRTWTWQGHKRVAYVFDVIVDGVRERKQFPTRAEAQAALDARREEAKNPRPEIPTLGLGEALTQFLALKARKPSVRQYRRIAEHLKGVFGADTPLVAIDAERISAYKAQRLATKRGERHLSPAAINRPLAVLRHLLRLARKWKKLAEVPEFEMEKERGRLRWLRPEEAVRLLDACREARNPALTDIVEFSLFTGVRQGEALGLTWDRVERARGVVRLEETKNGERRDVHLSANADAVLARRWRPEAEGYVFGTRNWNTFRTAWENAVERAKLTDLRFHDLRHTCASWLVQQGRPLKEVQEVLGHKTLTMTLRYAHLAPDNLRAAVSSLDGILSRATAQERHKEPSDVERVA